MTTNDSDQHTRRLKTVLRISGALLWVLAFAGMYLVWRGYRLQAERPTVSPVTSATLKAIEEDPAQKPIRLQPKRSTGELQSAWDPAGIADFSLTERSGKTVTKADLLGKPWAVCFVFTRCAGPCLTITGQMSQLQEQLQDVDVQLVTITVDPKHDTPEKLQKYADAFGADPEKWLFLTGDQQEIYDLIIKSFRLLVEETHGEERKPGFEVIHSANILHVSAEGVVQDKYDGRDSAAAAELVKALKQEAAQLAAASSAAPTNGNGQDDAAVAEAPDAVTAGTED